MINVLIVDDEIRLAEAFREQLTEEGMHVTVAHRAKEALSIPIYFGFPIQLARRRFLTMSEPGLTGRKSMATN